MERIVEFERGLMRAALGEPANCPSNKSDAREEAEAGAR
jgi:hypothetical protein